MVKRGRELITQDTEKEACAPDLWETQGSTRAVKKQRYTVLPGSVMRAEGNHNHPIQHVDKDTALRIFNELRGEEGALESTPSVLLSDQNVLQIQRAKLLSCPSSFGGSKVAYLGRIFLRPECMSNMDTSLSFVHAEVLETDFHCVVMECEVKRDVFLHHPNGLLAGPVPTFLPSSPFLQRGGTASKNTFLCRYRVVSQTGAIEPICPPSEGE